MKENIKLLKKMVKNPFSNKIEIEKLLLEMDEYIIENHYLVDMENIDSYTFEYYNGFTVENVKKYQFILLPLLYANIENALNNYLQRKQFGDLNYVLVGEICKIKINTRHRVSGMREVRKGFKKQKMLVDTYENIKATQENAKFIKEQIEAIGGYSLSIKVSTSQEGIKIIESCEFLITLSDLGYLVPTYEENFDVRYIIDLVNTMEKKYDYFLSTKDKEVLKSFYEDFSRVCCSFIVNTKISNCDFLYKEKKHSEWFGSFIDYELMQSELKSKMEYFNKLIKESLNLCIKECSIDKENVKLKIGIKDHLFLTEIYDTIDRVLKVKRVNSSKEKQILILNDPENQRVIRSEIGIILKNSQISFKTAVIEKETDIITDILVTFPFENFIDK